MKKLKEDLKLKESRSTNQEVRKIRSFTDLRVWQEGYQMVLESKTNY